MAAKAVAFKEAMEPGFVEYQKQVVANAQALAPAFMDAGFHVVSGGTDTHLMLVDVFSKGVAAKRPKPPSTAPVSRSTRTPSPST